MKHIRTTSTALLLWTLLISFAWTTAVLAQPQFNIVKPSTTGVAGEELRVMGFDPEGNLWVGGRWPFWGEGGLAMLSRDQLPYEPLPGGGFDTGRWKVWSNVHNPIPSPYLSSLKFAADGTIWLGSDGGLTRFRRNAAPADMWFTYTPANSPMLLTEVRSVAIDSQGNVWVANAGVNGGGGLFKFNPASNQWTHINPGVRPRAVTIGNNDHVLVTMSNANGFMEFDGTTWVTRGSGVPPLDGVLQDAQGNVWGLTGNSGLWKWNGSSWQNWQTVGGTITMTGIGKDLNGVVCVSTWYGGVYKMINDNPVFFLDADNIPGSLIQRPDGEIWIKNYGGNGTAGTVRHYTANGQLLERINGYNSGLTDYFVDRIKADSEGNMWFASGEGGLCRMKGSDGAPGAATNWRAWNNHNDAAEPYPWAGNEPMYSVFEEGNGIFWFGGNGVGRWDSNTGTFTNFWNWQNSNVDTSGVEAIIKRGNTMWIGTGGSGISWFDGTNWNRVLLSQGQYSYPANNVRGMTIDTQDNLWVASEFALRKFEAGNNTTYTTYHNGNTPMPNGSMNDVESDPAGGIWAATYGGLVRFDGTTWSSYTQANTGMPGVNVTDVARRASDGLIAIASNQGGTAPYTGGVSTFDGTTWTHFTPENSPLTHWQVHAVEFDRNGNLWASAYSEGLVQILIGPAAPLQLTSAVSRKTHGAAGTFDINLPMTGEPAVECRSGGAHTLVFTFDADVASGSAQIASGAANLAGNPVFTGNTMIVNLSQVQDLQTVTVMLNNVTATSGGRLPSTAVTLHILAGDTTGNKTVNASDVGQAKAESGQAVVAQNFRTDVAVNGSINASDVALVKSQAGKSLGSGR